MDNIISCLKNTQAIDSIVLGVAEGSENDIFVEYACINQIGCIRGDENDVCGGRIQHDRFCAIELIVVPSFEGGCCDKVEIGGLIGLDIG